MAKAEQYFIFKGLIKTSCLCFPRYSTLYFPRDLPIKATHSPAGEKKQTHQTTNLMTRVQLESNKKEGFYFKHVSGEGEAVTFFIFLCYSLRYCCKICSEVAFQSYPFLGNKSIIFSTGKQRFLSRLAIYISLLM